MSQYFQLFRLPERFEIDTAQLEQTYRTLAAQLHPDKFAAASLFEQKQAVMMSATVNQAYAVLSNPIDRAAYLLQQQGIHADAPEHTRFAPEFLMQQMQWREQLAQALDAQDNAAIGSLHDEIAAERAALLGSLKQQLDGQDYQAAAQSVRQGRFLDKMLVQTGQAA